MKLESEKFNLRLWREIDPRL